MTKGTPQWQSARPGRHAFPKAVAKAILRRDGECMLRIHPDCSGQAEEADHIVSWADATRAGWDPVDIDDPGNGRAVCSACHSIVTRAQQRAGVKRYRALAHRPTPPHPGLL